MKSRKLTQDSTSKLLLAVGIVVLSGILVPLLQAGESVPPGEEETIGVGNDTTAEPAAVVSEDSSGSSNAAAEAAKTLLARDFKGSPNEVMKVLFEMLGLFSGGIPQEAFGSAAEASESTSGTAAARQEIGTVKVNTYLNVRASPNGKIIGRLYNGNKVTIIGRSGNWLKISYNGSTAYVFSQYVNTSGSTTSTTTSSNTGATGTTGSTSSTKDSAELANWKGGKLPKAQFIKMLAPLAQEQDRKYGIPASVTIAQAALETGWGQKTIASGKNLFGIKALGGAKGSIAIGIVNAMTTDSGVRHSQPFRKYASWGDSIRDHSLFLQGKRYQPCMAAKNNSNEFARQLQKCGYCPDSDYASTLISIMKTNNLYQYDV